MFRIDSFLKIFGHTEDGEEFVAETYFIVADLQDGTRFAHFANFPCTSADSNEEGIPCFPDLREGALADAERLLGRINVELQNWKGLNADALNPDYWCQIRPAYGSEAYVSSGQEQIDLALEKEEG